jgi:HAD superfamily hydrolase (TIGR01509 family)
MVIKNWNEIDLQAVQGILLDLDDTLYDYELCHSVAYLKSKSIASAKYNVSEAQFDEYWQKARYWVNQNLKGMAASHSRLLYFQKMHELLYDFTNAEFALEMEELYWNAFLNRMEFKPGVIHFLEKVLKLNIRVCIVTDLTAQIQLQKWEKLNLQRFVQFMVSSEEAGIEKPNASIFELALKKLKLENNQVIVIGDNTTKDIEGAKQMGILSYLVNKETA